MIKTCTDIAPGLNNVLVSKKESVNPASFAISLFCGPASSRHPPRVMRYAQVGDGPGGLPGQWPESGLSTHTSDACPSQISDVTEIPNII